MNATRRSCRVYKNHQLKFKIQKNLTTIPSS